MCSRLKEARLKAGYTIEEVAEHLYIKKRYLVGIEENDLSSIPTGVYVNGYLKLYAEHLNVTLDNLNHPQLQTPDNNNQVTSTPEIYKEFKLFNKLNIISLIMLIITITLYNTNYIYETEKDVVSVIDIISTTNNNNPVDKVLKEKYSRFPE